jgi:hypothetical protein
MTTFDEFFNPTPHSLPIETSPDSLIGFVVPLMEMTMYLLQNGGEQGEIF